MRVSLMCNHVESNYKLFLYYRWKTRKYSLKNVVWDIFLNSSLKKFLFCFVDLFLSFDCLHSTPCLHMSCTCAAHGIAILNSIKYYTYTRVFIFLLAIYFAQLLKLYIFYMYYIILYYSLYYLYINIRLMFISLYTI